MDDSALANAESWLAIIGWVKLAAAFLVAIGVALEFGGDWISRPYERIVARARDQQLTELRAGTAGLEAEATAARLQIADAQKHAAEARERAAKIEQAAAWRVLSSASRDALTAFLINGVGGEVELSYPANDPEALFLARQIADAFDRANAQNGMAAWKITVQPRQYSHAIFWGIRIYGKKEDVVRSLQAAFTAAQLGFGADPVPNILNDSPGMMIGGTNPLDAMIFVGSKLPPN